MSWSSKVKYSQLPTSDTGIDWHQQRQPRDEVSLDFSSAFSYKSAFTYSKVVPPYVQEERSKLLNYKNNRKTLMLITFSTPGAQLEVVYFHSLSIDLEN